MCGHSVNDRVRMLVVHLIQPPMRRRVYMKQSSYLSIRSVTIFATAFLLAAVTNFAR